MLAEFIFKGKVVRFVGTQEKPEWVAQDVCECLEIKNTTDALATLKPTMRSLASIETTEGLRNVNTVFESGLYKLIFKSRKKVAEEFQDWIFEEVLPEIRRTGSYIGKKPNKVISESIYSHKVRVWETRLRHQVPIFVSIAMLVFDGDANAMYDILKSIAEKNPNPLIINIPYEAVTTFFALKQLGYFSAFFLTDAEADLLLPDALPKL